MKKLFALSILLLMCSSGVAQTFGNARFTKNIDPFTDADTSRIVIQADEARAYGRTPFLVWRCDQNQSDGYVFFLQSDEYLGSMRRPVRYRFDENQATGWEYWSSSTDGTGVFADSVHRLFFTEGAVEASRVTIGVRDYNETVYAYTFDLSGLRDALSALPCVNPDDLLPVTARAPISFPLVIHTDAFVPDAYATIKGALRGVSYTEGLNIMYAPDLTIEFAQVAEGGTTITLSGSNQVLGGYVRDLFD